MSTAATDGDEAGLALAAVRIAGADARAFLQGQLSNDLRLLGRDDSLLAALNTPQGRVVAILRLFERDDGIHALLPRAVVATTIERLRKYVLRSKVSLAPADDLSVVPVTGRDAVSITDPPPAIAAVRSGAAPTSTPLPSRAARHWQSATVSVVSFEDPVPRLLLVGPPADIHSLLAAHGASAASWNDWRLAQIAAGEPQVHAQTSEHFVAQMLNLDLLGAVSFTKGCYTGQEIIVRTQHLGRIKRRMVRLRANGWSPAVGDKVMRGAQAIGEVVQAATLPDGQCDLLAVMLLAQLAGPAADVGDAGLQRLALPYPTDEELADTPL